MGHESTQVIHKAKLTKDAVEELALPEEEKRIQPLVWTAVQSALQLNSNFSEPPPR